MEVQIFGTCANQSELELKLRAAGATTAFIPFRTEEEITMRVPSTTGAIQAQVRLITLDTEDGSFELIHEADMTADKENVIRVVSVDRVTLRGKAKEALSLWGFKEELRVIREGFSVQLPGGWSIEYFTLSTPKTASSKRARVVLEQAANDKVFIVTVKRPLKNEREAQSQISEAAKLMRRLSPEFQSATLLSIFGRTLAKESM
jgi:hypothetical protein